MLEQFEAHNIVKRMQNIFKDVKSNGFTETIGMDFNKLDSQVTKIMLRSEDRLSQDDTPYAYSEDLDRQMRIVRLIKKNSSLIPKITFHLKLMPIAISKM